MGIILCITFKALITLLCLYGMVWYEQNKMKVSHCYFICVLIVQKNAALKELL